MAYNIPWAEVDDNPTKSDQASNLDVYVRKVPDAIAERLTNMFSGFAQGETAEGIKRLEFIDQASDPADNKTVYTKSGEAYLKDGASNIVQLTIDGRVPSSFPSGTKMLFYQDTAPVGWTIQDTLDDKVVCITKGSAAGGETGGGVHSSGSWTQPTHVHAGGLHTHTLTIPITGYGGIAQTGSGYMQTNNPGNVYRATTQPTVISSGSGTEDTSASATVNTWRPDSYCCIICSKD